MVVGVGGIVDTSFFPHPISRRTIITAHRILRLLPPAHSSLSVGLLKAEWITSPHSPNPMIPPNASIATSPSSARTSSQPTMVPPGGFNIGKSLVWWFVYSLMVGVLVAYVGWNGLDAGAGYLDVFQITGAAAVLGYAVGYFHESIWKGASWGTTAKFILDGVAYSLVTAGTFGWLWPAAV